MTKDSLLRQVARWAEKAGAGSERIKNYAGRAETAFDQLIDLSGVFADGFNKSRLLKVDVFPENVGRLVEAYNRRLMDFKLRHGISIEDRIDTYICAGLWFCAIVQEPVFTGSDATLEEWDMATQEQLDAYYCLVSHFAFYFAFRVLRGHFKNFEEAYLLNILRPIRKYMVDHCEDIAACPAAAVGIFLAVSVFDKDCKEPPILS